MRDRVVKVSTPEKSRIFFFLRFYLFISRQRRREGEREGEKHQCVVASCTPFTGDPDSNPGMCLDWEPNRNHLVCRHALSPVSHTSQG